MKDRPNRLINFFMCAIMAYALIAFVVVPPSCGALPDVATEAIKKVDRTALAVTTACEVLELGQCWTDPIVQAALPGVDYATCKPRVNEAIATWPSALTDAEYGKILSKSPSCFQVYEGLRWPLTQ
jgi:hypothetical protein